MKCIRISSKEVVRNFDIKVTELLKDGAGINEIVLTKANEDDLRVLVSKQFVYLLNEDLVVFIEDWLEMNYFRADRKKDSRYKPLLLEQRPDVKLIEAKERSDTRRGKAKSQSKDSSRTAQPNLIQSNIIEPNLTEDKISIYLSGNK